jgi:hypothetical protein
MGSKLLWERQQRSFSPALSDHSAFASLTRNGRLTLGHFLRFICNVLAHRAALPWPIHNSFRMFAPKCLCDMAAPANRQMRFKYLWKFLGGNLIPLNGLIFGAQQRGPVIMPMNPFDGLTAIRARSAAIPLLDNTPH